MRQRGSIPLAVLIAVGLFVVVIIGLAMCGDAIFDDQSEEDDLGSASYVRSGAFNPVGNLIDDAQSEVAAVADESSHLSGRVAMVDAEDPHLASLVETGFAQSADGTKSLLRLSHGNVVLDRDSISRLDVLQPSKLRVLLLPPAAVLLTEVSVLPRPLPLVSVVPLTVGRSPLPVPFVDRLPVPSPPGPLVLPFLLSGHTSTLSPTYGEDEDGDDNRGGRNKNGRECEDTEDCSSFSPSFEDSPVIICVQPEACRFG